MRLFTIERAALLVPLLLLLLCLGDEASAQTWVPTPQFEAMMELAVALRGKDIAKVMSLIADGAMILPPDREIISGRKAIEDALKKFFANHTLQLKFGTLGSSASSDLGYDVGLFELTIKPSAGAEKKSRGKYLVMLRQDGEGHWRVARLMWNNEPAAPPP